MVLEAPLYMQANTTSARQDRQLLAALLGEGVVDLLATELKVSTRAAGANMSVDVAAGRAVIAGDDQAGQGSYFCRSDAVANLPIGAAPGADSRIDLVVARVRDATVTGGVSSDWILEVIPGAVAAAPVAPAVPGSAIPLAQVTVAAGTLSIDAAKITDRRAQASLPIGNAAYAPSSPAAVRVHRAANATLANATGTVIEFGAETFDTSAFHDNGVNPSRLTIPAGLAGRYLVLGQVSFVANGTGDRQVKITKNGVDAGLSSARAAGAIDHRVHISSILTLAAGDFLELVAFQSSGAALDVQGADALTWFGLTRLGSA